MLAPHFSGRDGDHAYIRTTALLGFHELVERIGGDPDALLRMADIAAGPLHDIGGLMSFRRYVDLHEISARELNRPAFALEWVRATPSHFPNLGPLAYLGYFATDIREWAETGLCYWRLHCNGFTMQLFEDIEGPDAIFRYRHLMPSLPMRQATERTLGNIVELTRVIGNHPDKNPTLVRFQHARPRDISLHEAMFRCPLEFDAEHSEILFDKEALDYKTVGAIKLPRTVLGFYIRSRLRAMPIYDQTMKATVELAVAGVIGTRRCNVQFVSDSLGLTPKKLQRLLAEEGTSFSDILDDARRAAAIRMVKRSNAPIANIAGLLDYSSTPAFILAFKRWMRMSPTKFRRSGTTSTAA